MTERPARVTGSAFAGLAIDLGASGAFAFLTGILLFVAAYRGGGHPSYVNDTGWRPWMGVWGRRRRLAVR